MIKLEQVVVQSNPSFESPKNQAKNNERLDSASLDEPAILADKLLNAVELKDLQQNKSVERLQMLSY